MIIDFSDNVKQDIKDFISTIPFELNRLNAHNLIDSYEDIAIRITENERFQCEIAFGTIQISESAIELIWYLIYSHWQFYELFCRGIRPDGQTLNLTGKEWDTPKKMLRSAVNAILRRETLASVDESPRTFTQENNVGLVARYALLFFLSHELFHLKWNGKTETPFQEEDNCDKDAVKLILNTGPDDNYLLKAKGVCLGLMVINVYGIHTNNFDGQTHPYSYDRLIDNLSSFFGPDNDKIWGLVVAIFSLHLTQIEIPQPNIKLENFYECVLEYKRVLEKNA